jgi:drug/metabolite transporter (DMT)-like permease
MHIKYITREKIGFNSERATFNALFIFSGLAFLFGALPHWSNHEFYPDLLPMGFACGTIACIGIVLLNTAFTIGGPAGPCTAISAMSSPALVVCVAIKEGKMISALELIGVILGMFGALIMTNHELFEKYCFCCCIKNKKISK